MPPNKPLYQNIELLPILADAAFPLKKYLLKTYGKPKLVDNNSNKILYYRLSRTRRNVENAFGILRAKFWVFQGPLFYYFTTFFLLLLLVQPNIVDKIVLAACCLHIFLTWNTQERGDTFIDESKDGESSGLVYIGPLNRNPTQEAIHVRESFKNYFVSSKG